MPALIIGFVGGNWTAAVQDNPNLIYIFRGNSVPAQRQAVNLFQQAMEQDETTGVVNLFVDVDVTNEEFVQQMFGGTADLMLDAATIFDSGAGLSILDQIEAAGEALGLALS